LSGVIFLSTKDNGGSKDDLQRSKWTMTTSESTGDEPRKLIAIRTDPKVLAWLRKTADKRGLPYQSLVNEILAEEMRKAS